MKHATLIFIAALMCRGQANPVNPTLPQLTFTVSQPARTGSVIAVHSGDNLQAKYNAASCGDQLVLDAGATFTGNFLFNKQCTASNWIQIVSSALASIPVPTYATAAQANNQNTAAAAPAAANYAKIISGNGGSPITMTTDPGFVPAKYHYLAGLEVTNTIATSLVISGTGFLDETLTTQLVDHIYFDRMYLHGITGSSAQMFPRGFLLQGSYVGVVNSYVQDIYSTIQDSQAILIAFGPGPFTIQNNFLEGSGETIMAGGTGRTPGFSCTVLASPAPTTTTATVASCVNAANSSVATPAAGTCAMFITSATAPAYIPDDWTCITSNSSGSLTFRAIHAPPLAGTNNVRWGIVPSDITISGNVLHKPPTWNPSNSHYDGVSNITCTVAASPAPTTTSATLTNCVDANGGAASLPGAGSPVIFYIGGLTVTVTLSAVNNGTGAATFPAQTAAPTAGVRQCLLGGFRDAKNLLESKYGTRWLVNGNIMQHSWNGGQGGGININASDQNGDCPWCIAQDITFTNNILQDLFQTIGIIPAQSYSGPAPGPLERLLIKNNLFWPQTGGNIMNVAGYIVNGGDPPPSSRNGADSVQIIHNHLLGPGVNLKVGGSVGDGLPQNFTNLVIKDNLTEFDQYRWTNQCITNPDGTVCINSTLNTNHTSTISNNAIVNTGPGHGDQGVADATLRTRYGSLILNTIVDSYTAAQFVNFGAMDADYHNFALASGSPFHGLASDGTDPGVNFSQLDAAFGGAPAPSGGPVITGKVTVTGKASVR